VSLPATPQPSHGGTIGCADIPEPSAQNPTWTDRYLRLLGLEREAPGLEALTRLVRAHVLNVPFENVTALLRRRDCPAGPVPAMDLDGLLYAWERRAGGGICFELAAMFSKLLTSLGYDLYVMLARVSLPNGHQAIHVTLDGQRYLVDLGTGGPIFQPIPLGDLPFEIHQHGVGYRFRFGDEPDQLLREALIQGEWTVSCRYTLRPATDQDRDRGYQHHHVVNASWVTGTLTMTRSTTEAVYTLKDSTLTRYTEAEKTVEAVTDRSAYIRLAAEPYGLPQLPISEALDVRDASAKLATGPTNAR
jgi:N-hydroxyarylamine O-acetyltransferase